MSAPAWPEPHEYDLPEAQRWDRMPSEPSRAYAAFRCYRDLPPSQRHLPAVAEQEGIADRTARAWCLRWDWHERAEAWDDACHRVEDQERLDAIRQMHAMHRRAGRAALAKAVQGLQYLDPEHMPPTLIARLLELGAKLERATLLTSVEELQGVEVEDEAAEDPWERIARELDPHSPADL